MYIEKLHIDTFGRLSNYDMELSPGVNIIEGGNESGKSTLAAFIKFMFYGIPSRERASQVSWSTGGAAGSLTINTGSHRYRIERALVSSGNGWREALQLVDLENNMPCHKGECPGELFLGVDAELFSATSFVSQLGTGTGGRSVAEGVENILFSADETVNTQKAAAKLDAARVALLHKNEKGGRLYELTNECAAMEARLAAALNINNDILAKEAQLADVKKNRAAAAEKAKKLNTGIGQFEARTLVKLFERMHALEKRCNELKAQIDRAGAPDPAEMNKLKDLSDRITLMKQTLTEAEERWNTLEQSSAAPEDEQLRDYMERGGREGIEAEASGYRSSARAYLGVAIAALLLGIAGLIAGIVPLLLSRELGMMWILGGILLLALSITMFILRGRQTAKAEELEYAYDCDALDAAKEAKEASAEAAKFAYLAVEDARRRLDELNAEAEGYGGSLDEALAKMSEKFSAVEDLKTEYDKHSNLLSGMREQLSSYNEAELRSVIDLSIDISDIDAANLPALRRDAGMASKMAVSLEKHETELEKALAALYPTAENPSKLDDRLNALKQERAALEKKHAAYVLACEKLEEAGSHLRESVAPRLAANTTKLMSHITGGRYHELGVGSQFEMSADTESGQKPLSALSAGTQDAAYLSLRLSLIDLLYRKCPPPVIYDESFSRMDDERLTSLLQLVRAGELQSLILTSNGRDASLMRTLGEFRQIKM
ncbi:MAG: AAA family ATPase [Clostridia bacterium]|nr:AAA family ATPase [Clostridia bacterium]